MPYQRLFEILDEINSLDKVKTDIPAPDNDRDPILEEQESERQWNSGVTVKCGVTVGFNKFRDIPGNLCKKLFKKG